MKNKFIVLALFAAMAVSGAQYSGVKTIKASGGDYASIYALFTEMNLDSLSGDFDIIITPPITEPTANAVAFYPNGHVFSMRSSLNHGYLLTSPAITQPLFNGISVRYLNEGTLIIDGLYLKAGSGVAINNSGIYYNLPIGSNVIIKNCLIHGCNKWTTGIHAQLYDKLSIENNIVLKCLRGIFVVRGNTDRKYLGEYVNNNTVWSCDTGIVHSYTALSTNATLTNNLCIDNSVLGFLNNNTAIGINNVSTDASAHDTTWRKFTTNYGNAHSNITGKNSDSLFASTDSTSSNFLRLKTAKHGRGINVTSQNNRNFYYDIQQADYGAVDTNRLVSYDPLKVLDTMLWPYRNSTIAKIMIVKNVNSPNIFNDVSFIFTNGSRLKSCVDTVYGDTAVYFVRSPHYLNYGDTVFVYNQSNNTQRQFVFDFYGLNIKPNKHDSLWSFNNFNRYDHRIGTSGEYQAYPGISYSLDRKRFYLTYRETALNYHGYDSSAVEVFKSFAVDTTTGKVLFDSLLDSNGIGFGSYDMRGAKLSVFDIDGVETLVRYHWLSQQVSPPDSSLQGPYASYVEYSTDRGHTWSDTIRLFGDHTIANYGEPKLWHDDSVIVIGHAPYVAGICTTYIAKAHKNNLNSWQYHIGTLCDSSQIECNLEELKTHGQYSGRGVVITRDVQYSLGSIRLAFTNDYGGSWSYPMLHSYYGYPKKAGQYPTTILRLMDSTTILTLGGSGQSGNGGRAAFSSDEFGTFYQYPESWINGDSCNYLRLYQAAAEWKDGKILIAFCNNTFDDGSDLLFKYFNTHGYVSMADTSLPEYYRPVINNGRIIFDSTAGLKWYIPYGSNPLGGQDYIFHTKSYSCNTYTYVTVKEYAIDISAKLNNKTNVGVFYDTTKYPSSGKNKIERFFPFKRSIYISPERDSCFINNDDTVGTVLNHDSSAVQRYMIVSRGDTLKIKRNDTTLLARKIATAANKFNNNTFAMLLADNTGKIEIQDLKLYPPDVNDTSASYTLSQYCDVSLDSLYIGATDSVYFCGTVNLRKMVVAIGAKVGFNGSAAIVCSTCAGVTDLRPGGPLPPITYPPECNSSARRRGFFNFGFLLGL